LTKLSLHYYNMLPSVVVTIFETFTNTEEIENCIFLHIANNYFFMRITNAYKYLLAPIYRYLYRT